MWIEVVWLNTNLAQNKKRQLPLYSLQGAPVVIKMDGKKKDKKGNNL